MEPHQKKQDAHQIDFEEKLSTIIHHYKNMNQDEPIQLAQVLAEFAIKLSHKGVREEFVKIWMEKSKELDSNNLDATLFLIKYNWKKNSDLLNVLTFPLIRESDNPSLRKSKIDQYKENCYDFLELAEEQMQDLEKNRAFLEQAGHEEMATSFSNVVLLLNEILEETSELLHLLNEFEESASRTFYSPKFFDSVAEKVTSIYHLKDRWKGFFTTETEENHSNSLTELSGMVGLSEVKSRIESFYAYLKFQKKRKEAGFQSKDEHSLNMVLLGNPGTGKTTIARLLAKIYYELGVLPGEEVVETNRSQLVGSFVGQTEENVRMIVEKAVGGVLFIDEAYSLKREGQSGSDYGQTAIDTLVSLMTSKEYGGKFSVILAGYPEEMRQFLDSNTGLRSRFPASNIIQLPDYSNGELLTIGEKIALDNDFLITSEGKKELGYLIEQERVDTSFGNARTVQNLITQAIFKKGIKKSALPDFLAYSVLDKEDFIKTAQDSTESKTPMEKLNELIGLKEIKDAVETYISFVRMQSYRRDENLPHVPIQLHSVFTGNPGTGKTTVAKIYSELLKECGMLKRGHLVVVGRADLIAGYVGQSAIKTKKKIREALGGVLFIDEAYSLFRNNNSDFGKEVVDTLVEEMTKHNENLVVILAGYPKEMEVLLESNPGLKSRFKKFFHFPDYSPEELISIMVHYAHKYAYKLEETGIQFLRRKLTEHPVRGNGRFAENIILEAIQQQALRLMQSDSQIDSSQFNIIDQDDIKDAYEILKKGE